MVVGTITNPVIFELWDGSQENSVIRSETSYQEVLYGTDGVTASAVLENEAAGRIVLTDQYSEDNRGILLERTVKILKAGGKKGIRLLLEMDLFPEEETGFGELRYFAPPAIFDKNDLDEDGYEDYFHTQKTIFRDDRFNYPAFMAFSEKHKKAVRLERAPLPAYDSNPDRGSQ